MITPEELATALGPHFDYWVDELDRFITYFYPFGMVSLYKDGTVQLESQFVALGKDEIVPALKEFSDCYEKLRQISQNYMENKNVA